MKVSNYIITHKKFDMPKIKGYTPIQVGAENKDDLGYIKDNTGDNISIKNPNYCELTGIYWIWKNDKDSDIIGISHYRRYFAKKVLFFKKIIETNQIIKILKKYDIIVAKKEIYKESVYEQYCVSSGFAKDLEQVRKIIKEKYPEYMNEFNKLHTRTSAHMFNMFIMKKEILNDYCNWLFDILFEMENSVDLTEYNDYQKRIYGFIAERLLNVWILANNELKVKRVNVINTESKLSEKVRISLRRIKNSIIFYKNNRKNRL